LNPPRNDRGFTLIEVVIATMLMAVGVTAVFSVALTARYRMNRNLLKSRMSQEARRLSDDLKNFVTYDSTIVDGAPGSAWRLPDDQCSQWALSEYCVHDVTGRLPGDLRKAPVSASLAYSVSVEPRGHGYVRKVDIQMRWTEPE